MDPLYLSVWSTILRVAVTDGSGPIASFTDPAQAMQHMHLQNTSGDTSQVITNDGKWYWLVSASTASRLRASDFYPVIDDRCV